MNIKNTANLGTFECKTGTLWVTDPCYDPGTWCQAKLESVRKGTFGAFTRISDEADWGDRVVDLLIVHTDIGVLDPEDERFTLIEATIGVDAGQAGFFDGDMKIGDGEYGDIKSFYGKCCHVSGNENKSGIIWGSGVNSSSGFGDGSYECFVIKDDRGEVIAAKIVFITEDEDEEDEVE